MFTFSDQKDIVIEEAGTGTDTAAIAKIERDINRGGLRFYAALGREFNRKSRSADLEADIDYYQNPEDAQRITLVLAISSGGLIPLTKIDDEETWRYLKQLDITGEPTHFFVRGFDGFELYPKPSNNVTDGLMLVFEPKAPYFRASDIDDDITSSTVTVTQGDQTVTSSGTPFTPGMVGRGFEVTDGTDTRWYRISEYTDSSHIELENYYQGASGSAKTFRIGEVMDLPEEYLEGPSAFALWRHWKRRGNKSKAVEAFQEFTDTLDMAREWYAQQTSSAIVNASDDVMNRAYNPFRGDSYTVT
jgi:hypothetical protein